MPATTQPVPTEEAEAFMQEALTVNLSAVIPEPVAVTIVEYRDVLDGAFTRREAYTRTAWINTFVPMTIFHQMLLSRQRMLAQNKRKKIEIMRQSDGSQEIRELLEEEAHMAEQEAVMDWVLSQVWHVWKMTEPDMTLERLKEGLEFEKVYGLFTRFFDGLIRTWRQKGDIRRIK